MTGLLAATFRRRFPGGPVVEADLRIPIDTFHVTVLFGPSGAGKSTLLRVLAGLERPESGTIRFGDETWCDSERRIWLPPQERDIGLMFQEYALFPHLSVAENVAFGISRLPAPARRARLEEALEAFDLTDLRDRYPHQVSGGQQQRIALARTLIRRPRLLLLDEPLSALDAPLRYELQGELRRYLVRHQVPVLLVTHDPTEAANLGDDVAVMEQGTIRQRGPLAEVFQNPVSVEVARIVGMDTILSGTVVDRRDGRVTVDTAGIRWSVPAAEESVMSRNVSLCFRAEDVRVSKETAPQDQAENSHVGRIERISSDGPMTRIELRSSVTLSALVTKRAVRELGLGVGDTIRFDVPAAAIRPIQRME